MRGSQASRLPRPAVLATVTFLLFLAIVLAASADTAAAKSGFLGDFNAAYGTAGTPLDSCSLCHTNVPSLNGYGTDWRDNGKNFAAIEPLDSDGDGWTNIQEIQARTMPGNAASSPPPATTTTQPPGTTQPPSTTQPPTTTLPPPGSGPLTLSVTEFNPPGSVDVNGGNVSREMKVKARVDNAEEDENVTAQIQLFANGQLVQTISKTDKAEDDGEVKFEVKFNFTFTTSHVPKIDWWAIIVVDGQASSAATGTTTVIGPAPPTTTTQPPGTTQPPSTTLPPGTTQPPGGVNGAAIYAASCAGCHGADGSGGFGGPVAGTSMSLGQVVTITANGAGGMPGFTGQLSSAEIDAVSAFVLTLGGGGGEPPATTTTTLPPGTAPGSGAALYQQYCASCHGANADGGVGGTLVGSPLSFSQQVSVTSQGRGTMPGFNSTLTSGEIDSIIRYVANLGSSGSVTTTTTVPPDEESGSSIYGRLCAACHGGDGSGGPGGPILGTSFHGSSLAGVITDGVGTMPAFGSQLNDGQVTRLVAYVEALSRGEVNVDGDAEDLFGDVLVDPAEGFNGHIAESGASGEDSVVALGAAPSASPLPVGNPLGWSLALAIAAVMIAVGSAFTGAMPKDVEDRPSG